MVEEWLFEVYGVGLGKEWLFEVYGVGLVKEWSFGGLGCGVWLNRGYIGFRDVTAR